MVIIKVYSNRPAGPCWSGLSKMAGAVREKFAPDVKVEVIYKGLLGIGTGGDGPKPPNVFVDDVELGKSFTQEELEKVVAQKLRKEK